MSKNAKGAFWEPDRPVPCHFGGDGFGGGNFTNGSVGSTGLISGITRPVWTCAAVLPIGWTKSTRQLKKDLILNPAVGSDGPYGQYHYLAFRDSADNTYHQVGWSAAGSLEAQVDCGLGAAGHILRHPIWGGQGNEVLAGDAGGVRNDLMHGGAGDDVFYPGLGDDEIWGDAGIDSVVLPGRLSDYTVTELSSDFTKIVLDGGSRGTKTIYYCEFIHFDDVRLAVKAFHAQSVR